MKTEITMSPASRLCDTSINNTPMFKLIIINTTLFSLTLTYKNIMKVLIFNNMIVFLLIIKCEQFRAYIITVYKQLQLGIFSNFSL